jgi:profilin
MAGWNAYIKNLMDSSDAIVKAAIVGCDDGGVWARTEAADGHEEFTASSDELRKFVALFDKLEEVPQTGFYLEGTRYIVPRVEENLIFGKKDKTGVFAVKTNMAVLIACYQGETEKGQEARTAVEKLGAYLQQSGY